jgi:lipoprotein-releasing system ATP-binding protein
MSIAKLTIKDLYKSFVQGGKTLNVLRGVNAEFEQGKTYAITGVSGSGKSTLLHLLGGLDNPSSGKVFFDEQNLFKLRATKKEKFLNKNLGFVFQFHYLIKELTILENIIMPGLIKGNSHYSCKKKAKQLLASVELSDKIYSYPTELSGGQLQRVAILRAIFNKPSFLLADEPTGDLDAQNAETIVNLFLKCQRDWGMGVVMCSHDKEVYGKMEKVLNLHDGVLKGV